MNTFDRAPSPKSFARPGATPETGVRQRFDQARASLEAGFQTVIDLRDTFERGNLTMEKRVTARGTESKVSFTAVKPPQDPPRLNFEISYRAGHWFLAQDSDTHVSGNYRFVVLKRTEDEIQAGTAARVRVMSGMRNPNCGHDSIAGHQPVSYAGWVRFSRGRVMSWDDGSGHFLPHPGLARICPFPYEKFRSAQVRNAMHARLRDDVQDILHDELDEIVTQFFDAARLGNKAYFKELFSNTLHVLRERHSTDLLTRRMVRSALGAWLRARHVP